MSRIWFVATVIALLALAAPACSTSGLGGGSAATGGGGGKLRVVAAENFWGSIAAQLGGDRVDVSRIISNPQTDPHDYEPTADDSRAIASAQYVILNGIGYDSWVSQAIDANPSSGRRALDIGSFLHLHDGDNPHRWYFPADVDKVIAQITSDYKQLDPKDASYFDQQAQQYETQGLAAYKSALAQITQRYRGTPVGATESIFVGLAQATGLDLVTPSSFLDAISEGTEPTSADKANVDAQITGRQVKVFVYNSQNSTPDVQALVDAARSASIPVTTVTETLSPAGASFQDWQTRQLQQLEAALGQAMGQ